MIHWLTQSSTSHSFLSAGRVPPGLLTPAEQVIFDGLKSDKRRHDWLLGRWTGKRLVQIVVGNGILPNGIEILAADDGAPEVRVQDSSGDKPLTLSMSHSADWSFCAVAEGAEIPLGADIERIENRSEEFVKDYFVREEIALVEATPSSGRDCIITAIWSAKEAALKAIRVGLTEDTYAVGCLPQGYGRKGWPPKGWSPKGWSSKGWSSKGWSPIEIAWDQEKLKRSAPALTGWWRVEDGFVLTIAAQPGISPKIETSEV